MLLQSELMAEAALGKFKGLMQSSQVLVLGIIFSAVSYDFYYYCFSPRIEMWKELKLSLLIVHLYLKGFSLLFFLDKYDKQCCSRRLKAEYYVGLST